MSGLFLTILIIINLFTARKIFSITTIIYYLILILSGVFGSMVGINNKDTKEH